MLFDELSAIPALWIIAAAILGYLLGSIPFGLLFTKAAGLGDVRNIGSGNIGATNVLRTGNKKLAAATLLCDALKGAVVAILFNVLFPGAGMIAGFFAFLGHLYPVWLQFKGGKGVATYIGVVFAIFWQGGFIFLGVWLITAFITRYSSLSALVAIIVVPLAGYFLTSPLITAILVLMGLLIIVKHRGNISRLMSGNESKIGAKGK